MPNFMLIAITRGIFRCVGQFATGPAVPSPWYGYMATEEVRRHPEAQNAGITGVSWSTGSFGIPRAPLALVALVCGALPLTPAPRYPNAA